MAFLKKSLQFQMNGDHRICTAVQSTERPQFAIVDPTPVTIEIPFYLMKEAVAQILRYEAEVALGKVGMSYDRMATNRMPKGIQGVLKMSELLMDAASLEAAGQAAVDDNGTPELEPNLKAILG